MEIGKYPVLKKLHKFFAVLVEPDVNILSDSFLVLCTFLCASQNEAFFRLFFMSVLKYSCYPLDKRRKLNVN